MPNVTVYAPDVTRVKPADIFLTYNGMPGSKIGGLSARSITAATRGDFSHALICSHPPSLVEALPGGARKLSLSRCWVYNINHVRVLRAESASSEALAKAGKLAEDEIGKPYSAILAFFSQQNLRDRVGRLRMLFSMAELHQGITSRRVFCSMLVAKAYTEANILNFGPLPQKVNPADIQNNSSLTDVTRDVFYRQETYGSEHLPSMAFLDGERPSGFTEKQTEEYSKIAESLLDPALKFVSNLSEREIRFNPTFLGMISLIEECDPASLNDLDRNIFLNFDQQFLSAIKSSNLLAILKEMYVAESGRTHRLINESYLSTIQIDRVIQIYLTSRSNYLNMVKEKDLLRELNRRWKSEAVAEYLLIQDYSVDCYEQQLDGIRHAIENVASGVIPD